MGKRRGEALDVAPLIRTVQFLDEVLKRGVVVGVNECDQGLTLDAEDVTRALAAVQNRIAEVHRDMLMLLRDAQKASCAGVQ